MDRAVTMDQMGEAFSRILGRPVKTIGMGPMGVVMGVMAVVSPRMRDMKAMVDFFGTGKYVADTTQQAKLLGPVPRLDDALRDYAKAAGLA
jgi:hypothetical protein